MASGDPSPVPSAPFPFEIRRVSIGGCEADAMALDMTLTDGRRGAMHDTP